MRARFSIFAFAFALNACFLGYDSRWGEAKRAQQRGAVAATPAALEGSPAPRESDAPRTTARSYRVRVYATATYAAQTVDWHRRAMELVDDANAVLAPSLGARLVIDEFRDWPGDEQSGITNALAALRETDAGNDVDWVIGMVGSLPRATASFHELGMASVVGKHAVVRAIQPAQERDAIDRAFYELKDEERTKLARVRARHRATAVLLHEIGHTLGAVHTRDARSLMYARYDTQMEAYGDAPLTLMRAALAHRDEGGAKEAQALLAALDATSRDAWAEDDRASLEERLRGAAAAKGTASTTVADGAGAPGIGGAGNEGAPQEPDVALPADVAALSPEARAQYAAAARTLRAGDALGARKAAGNLFEAQPDVFSVQDLRCKIAMAGTYDWTFTRAECSRLMDLSTAPAKK